MPFHFDCLGNIISYLGGNVVAADASAVSDLLSVELVCTNWEWVLATQVWKALCKNEFAGCVNFPEIANDQQIAAGTKDLRACVWKILYLRITHTCKIMELKEWGVTPAQIKVLVDKRSTMLETKGSIAAALQRDAHEFEIGFEKPFSYTYERRMGYSGNSFSSLGSHSAAPKWEIVTEPCDTLAGYVKKYDTIWVFYWEDYQAQGFPRTQLAPFIRTEQMTTQELEDDKLWWEIYEKSFPEVEREPPEGILLESERFGRVYRIRLNGNTAGLAVVHFLQEVPCGYLLYLGVTPSFRSLSLGSKLFSFVFDDVETAYQSAGKECLGLVWEVDPPWNADDVEERETRERRVRFYERLGAADFGGSYLQPPLRGGSPVPMTLMFRPCGQINAFPEPPQLLAIIRAMYWESFHGVNGVPLSVVEELFKMYLDDGPPAKWQIQYV
eukprot:TRINITY_DN1438_c0_g1_i1.p1 TRINITY_DN1438_c0_g1~~TRINITY_DN1438_c0_g1_i1.p1  ORF type:complete len:441 (-),score=60.25 TRINITY_DN1438_c0_g1_i1:570-1892(-)